MTKANQAFGSTAKTFAQKLESGLKFDVTELPSFKTVTNKGVTFEVVEIPTSKGLYQTSSKTVIGQLRGNWGQKIAESLDAGEAFEDVYVVEKEATTGRIGIALSAYPPRG